MSHLWEKEEGGQKRKRREGGKKAIDKERKEEGIKIGGKIRRNFKKKLKQKNK